MTPREPAELPSETLLDSWLAELAALRAAAHPGGTLGLVDAAARSRGAAAVRSGTCVSLSRPLLSDTAEGSRFRLTTSYDAHARAGRVVHGFDHLDVRQHGIDHTHLDAWNHYGVDGTFFPDVPADRPEEASVLPWAEAGVITRAVLLDVPAVRGSDWVDADEPATGDELADALARTGLELDTGDALLVYLGRDRFEAAGHRYGTIPDTVATGGSRPGLGVSAARWIADRRVSVVCWDFLDAVHPAQPPGAVHLLIWAIGLGLVDNCDLGPAVAALRREGRHDGMLALAPLRIPGATASLVNPLLLL